jgi:hypothetical protein
MIEVSPRPRERFVVRAPETYQPERRYVLDVVFADWLGCDYDLVSYSGSRVTIALAGDDRRELALPDGLFATAPDAWRTPASMPFRPLHRVDPSRHSGSELPVLFGAGDRDRRAWHESDGGLEITFDLLGGVFFFLTRYEEVVLGQRDPHGRFPASASLAFAEGVLHRPIVDEYVDILWRAIQTLWPGIQRPATTFRLRPTHDIDQPWATLGQPVGAVAHAIVGDVAVRRDVGLALRRVRSFFSARRGGLDGDPYDTFDTLMETSERHGLRSAFFVLAGNEGGVHDGRYHLTDPPVAALLRRIHQRGHEIGLHAGYASHDSVERTRNEFEALVSACRALGIEQETWGVRQHYLRFDNPHTWRNHEAAGLDYDSTLAFADEIGFRAGTCREYRLFDLLERRAMNLKERPLVVMDTTMLEYMGLGAAAATDRARAIISTCRAHQGDAVVLYHNSLLAGRRQQRGYAELLAEFAPARSPATAIDARGPTARDRID